MSGRAEAEELVDLIEATTWEDISREDWTNIEAAATEVGLALTRTWFEDETHAAMNTEQLAAFAYTILGDSEGEIARRLGRTVPELNAILAGVMRLIGRKARKDEDFDERRAREDLAEALRGRRR